MIIKCNKLPFDVNVIALYPFMFIKRDYVQDAENVVHENIHYQQQKELGLIFFLLLYGIEFLILFCKYRNRYRAYYNISFESEAYSNQANLDYLKDRKFWEWLKYYV